MGNVGHLRRGFRASWEDHLYKIFDRKENLSSTPTVSISNISHILVAASKKILWIAGRTDETCVEAFGCEGEGGGYAQVCLAEVGDPGGERTYVLIILIECGIN